MSDLNPTFYEESGSMSDSDSESADEGPPEKIAKRPINSNSGISGWRSRIAFIHVN